MLQPALHAIIDKYENAFGMLRIWVAGGRSHTLTELMGRDVKSDSYLIFRGMEEIAEVRQIDDL